MNAQSLAAALAGVAVLVFPPRRASRLRQILSGEDPKPQASAPASSWGSARVRAALLGGTLAFVVAAAGGWFVAAPAGVAAWLAARRLLTRSRRTAVDPLRLAATGDLLAACLAAGLPVPTAVRAVAGTAPADAAAALRSTAELLALGAEPAEAWEPALRCQDTAELARAARRTARSGSALAKAASGMAERARSAVTDQAEARAQRAGVLITGPLGLCFLPAFLCLGVVPVVLGLAGSLSVFP
ncbi:type II secretion system F family protein [Prauserella cavernicola]|uniref:Type II secretion system F family protein n=1 Tax=Prauserella cavernicola TaxID=2800127 RepID=A0A934QRS4_9PSEU|nr:type II secretion system F family protein [Prauserella cavernicola]MBK1785160.1 type II secretion system F family protein [Prauserella cavernicola]